MFGYLMFSRKFNIIFYFSSFVKHILNVFKVSFQYFTLNQQNPKMTHIFRLHFLVSSANHELLRLVEILEQSFLILQPQFLANDVEISNWIDLALDMSHVWVFESACDAEKQKVLLNLHFKPQEKIQFWMLEQFSTLKESLRAYRTPQQLCSRNRLVSFTANYNSFAILLLEPENYQFYNSRWWK